jgi:3-methyladenine DNA glycosylase/8-oxoguanine DNA glycosylase
MPPLPAPMVRMGAVAASQTSCTADEPLVLVWRPRFPVDVAAVLSAFRRGPGDPTVGVDPGGRWWLGLRTPAGPTTLTARARQAAAQVEAQAWGPGAAWAVEQLPSLLGASDDPEGFVPRHRRVADAHARYAGWRVPRSGLVMHALVPAVIEQRVTGREAFAAYRRLVRRFGCPAPGPGAARGLWVEPDARQWARIPSWDWLRAGVDPGRAATSVRCARHAGRLEALVGLGREESGTRLRSLRGVGVWTAAEVAHRALGDADAVSFGDYHVARDVGWALTGSEVDDDGLAELLEPYAGHRYRVQRLLQLDGARRPRRGPRMSPRTHLPVR